jgi:chaperonin GroES
MKKLIAKFDTVIVLPKESNESLYGNIIVPDMGKEKALIGEIVSVGPGKMSITGTFIPTSLKVGETVMLPQMGPVKVTFDGVDYYGCPEQTIMGVIEETHE